ncbi:MAG: phosphomannomutase/phosphoglucomutase [Candidatus Uhrbacteria bacterium]
MAVCNEQIFKAYDIRGVYGVDFDAAAAERIGRAVTIHTQASRVVVGRDMRTSSPELAAAVIRGITAQGADVVDIGLASTPMFNFAVATMDDVDAGIIVSASHNPGKYNGFKMDYADALPISAATGMAEVHRLAMDDTIGEPSASPGTVTERDVRSAYLDHLASLVDPATISAMKIVVDCGNGMGGYTMPMLAERLSGEVVPLYWDLDGTFPNHEADPVKPENLQVLAERVRREGAMVGFATDGDADRLGVVDESGAIVRGDLLAVLLGCDLLEKQGGSGHILCDIRGSRVCMDEVARTGGTSELTRVGHGLIKKHMRESGAIFAGELSGHYYYRDFFILESAELAMLHLLSLLSRSGKKLSELVAPLNRFAYSGEINFEIADKDAAIRRIEARFVGSAKAVSRLDGLRCDMGDWWFIVRPSNTEPLLRLIVEASDEAMMNERVRELGELVQSPNA